MEKVAITVRVPALDSTYDFIIPDSLPVEDVVQLIIKILSSEYGVSGNSEGAMLFDTSDQTALPPDCNFKQLGIFDGAHLLLI